MKAKFYGQAESTEHLPQAATPEEAELYLRYLALKEQIKAASEEMEQIMAKLPYNKVLYTQVGSINTTFYVDAPEYVHVRVKDLELIDKPTTKQDIKTLGLE